MMEILQQAQKDPQSLEGKLTPEQRAKIKAISQRLPAATPMRVDQLNQMK